MSNICLCKSLHVVHQSNCHVGAGCVCFVCMVAQVHAGFSSLSQLLFHMGKRTVLIFPTRAQNKVVCQKPTPAAFLLCLFQAFLKLLVVAPCQVLLLTFSLSIDLLFFNVFIIFLVCVALVGLSSLQILSRQKI